MSPTLIINHHDDYDYDDDDGDDDDNDYDDDDNHEDDDQPESGRHGRGPLLNCRHNDRSRAVDSESKLPSNPGIGSVVFKQKKTDTQTLELDLYLTNRRKKQTKK